LSAAVHNFLSSSRRKACESEGGMWQKKRNKLAEIRRVRRSKGKVREWAEAGKEKVGKRDRPWEPRQSAFRESGLPPASPHPGYAHPVPAASSRPRPSNRSHQPHSSHPQAPAIPEPSFPPWGRFLRSVRAFSHRGDAFSVPCVLFPTVGALFPFRACFFPQWGRFFRSVRAFSRRGGAFSAPCALFPTVGALFPFRARFFRSVRAFSDPCALFPLRVRFLQSGRKSPPTSSPHHKSPIPRLPSLFIPFLHSSLPYSQSLPPPHQSREAQPSTGQSREAKPFTRHNNRVRQSLLRDPTPHPSPRP
jgi:hypothetical protein